MTALRCLMAVQSVGLRIKNRKPSPPMETARSVLLDCRKALHSNPPWPIAQILEFVAPIVSRFPGSSLPPALQKFDCPHNLRARMNFIEFETAQKLRGGFYTDADIADFLARWVGAAKPRRLLEPSCGDGAFLEALWKHCSAPGQSVFACEINAVEAAKAKARAAGRQLEMHVGDFLEWFLIHCEGVDAFDGALGNPPFVRYQYLPEEQQIFAERIFKRFELPFTKHTNLWVPFVMATLALLRPGGRLGMVVPSEIFHLSHAQSLRRFLTEQCSRILILDPEQIWFCETLQGTVLLMAEKKHDPAERSHGVAVAPAMQREELARDPQAVFRAAIYTNDSAIEGKWMAVFLTGEERRLVAGLRGDKQVRAFGDLASVDVGIVTGANKFFVVPDEVVRRFGLRRWAHAMFGRSEHVKGLLYSEADHDANRRAGLPANFLWFQEENFEEMPANVRQYLELGVAGKLHVRYKCRVRTPWYKVPSVYVAPVGMLKRAHNIARLVLNKAGVYTTDTAYRIRPLRTSAESLVFGFVNSLTALTAEMEGRHYGGGVLELVPSEIERLLLPLVECDATEFAAADEKFRQRKSDETFLREQDVVVLSKIGLTKRDQEMLYDAWARLRGRRQRVRT
jgi:adenine-specific DNA-methyltransferase